MYNDGLKSANALQGVGYSPSAAANVAAVAAAVGFGGGSSGGSNAATSTAAENGGDSPIPSSNDSGTASPSACSFSPGADLDDSHISMLMRRQLELTKLAPRSAATVAATVAATPSQTAASNAAAAADWLLAREFAALSAARSTQPRHSVASIGSELTSGSYGCGPHLPSSLSSDAESGFLSSASSCASSGGGATKPLNSPIVSSPPSSSSATSSFGCASRLPVFERLSNGP